MKIAVLFDTPYQGYTHEDHVAQMEHERATREPEMEYQVGRALIKNGHETRFVGVHDDLSSDLDPLRDFNPDLVFNCAETFAQVDRLDYLLPAVLEAEGYVYTGSPPSALMITRNKGMTKKVLAHHDVKVPAFRTYRKNDEVTEDPDLPFPLFVKPLRLDASEGISLSSVVNDTETLAERIRFIHERIGGSAIAEQFIEGRELYVPLLGNGDDIEILPISEMVFDKQVEATARIATRSAKWDESYRQKRGIKNRLAYRIGDKSRREIERACRIAYKVLWLRDYARLDVRLDAKGVPWVLEANANPYLNYGHEMAMSAKKRGLNYNALIERIVQVAAARRG